MSPPNPLFEALFHTNRPVEISASANMRAVPGWWGEHAHRLGKFNVTGAYRKGKARVKLKAKWNLPQSLKFAWSVAAAQTEPCTARRPPVTISVVPKNPPGPMIATGSRVPLCTTLASSAPRPPK